MHPLYQALLSPWEWRLEILIVLITFGVMYTIGWARLRSAKFTAQTGILATVGSLLERPDHSGRFTHVTD